MAEKDKPIIGFFPDSAVSSEAERGKENRARRILPPQRPSGLAGRALGAFQDLALGAQAGLQAAQGGISLGDPFTAAVQGIAGGIQAPSAQAIREQQFLQQIDAVPIDDLSPDLVARYPEISGLPLGVAQKLLPVLERNERNEALMEKFLAQESGRESRFERGLEAREGAAQSKAEEKKTIRTEKEEASRRAALAQADRIISKVDQAFARVGSFSAGLGASLSRIPGSSAKDLETDLTTIKANLGFAELQAMRQASPTGGALGAIAVQELEALQSTLASLEQGQSPAQLRRNLLEVRRHYSAWRDAVAGAAAEEEVEAEKSNGKKKPMTREAQTPVKQVVGKYKVRVK